MLLPNAIKAMSIGKNGSRSRSSWRGIIVVATAAGGLRAKAPPSCKDWSCAAIAGTEWRSITTRGGGAMAQRRRPHEPPEARLLFDGRQAPRPGGGVPCFSSWQRRPVLRLRSGRRLTWPSALTQNWAAGSRQARLTEADQAVEMGCGPHGTEERPAGAARTISGVPPSTFTIQGKDNHVQSSRDSGHT